MPLLGRLADGSKGMTETSLTRSNIMASVHDTIKQQRRSNGRLQRTARIEEKVEAAELVRSSDFRSTQLTLIYNLPVSLSQFTNPIALIT